MSEKTSSQWYTTLGITRDDGRPPDDLYETHPSVVELMLTVEGFDGPIWEPACGRGSISRVLIRHGHQVESSDLHDWGYGTPGINFLTQERIGLCHDIITNPPFRLALEFARKGLSLLPPRGKMALFNRLAWLESKKRKQFFQKSPLKKVVVLSGRPPMMHRPDHDGPKVKTGTVAYAWFIWEDGYRGKPYLEWV